MNKEIGKKNKSDRTERITVRLSPENKRLLKKLKVLNEFESYEDLIMSFVNEQYELIEKEIKYIDEGGHCLNLLTQLNKYSSNLNQIAKAANTYGSITNEELKELKKHQTRLINAKRILSEKVTILKGIL
ncbi:plasmid mobilization relaxosome protein MobC [Vibrio diabolicus]|uniref:plasmid mobilization relaxosome protein MobC n=1 Tax=Vibrio diabolicus TaxID=50719 RepID=UPI0021513FEA|nr:plasmid mobilization relaxosome protein MobC [Vibrio diabolicus]MCE3220474.1 plasmid mobilization relaxosome protein MobC [Vibrio diabolicus]